MTRLIDADALRECFDTEYEVAEGVQVSMDRYALKCIDDAPTIDIAEVCGECKPYTPCIYCKHDFENKFETCGAKMDKGGDTE